MASLTLQRAALRALLSLPSPVLRSMSGGAAVYRGGRTLDPAFQMMAAMGRRAPPLASLPPEEARRVTAQALAACAQPSPKGVKTEPLNLEGPRGAIPARIYRPARQDPAAALMVYAHMGGGVIGDLATSDGFCGRLAETARGPVLSVEYRLAPEHRFPAGLEDVLAAYRWGRDHAGRLGAPEGQAAIGGDSIGGGFAAAVCQMLREAGEPQPVLQLLVYPCVDVASETASVTTYADAYPLSRATMDWFMGHYLGPNDDPADPRLSPLREPDLTGLAPAVIATAGFDPLLDQGELYARRLRQAGVRTTYRGYDGLAHGFTAFSGVIAGAAAACAEIAGLVRQELEGRMD